jgi:hypothetical protein
MIVPQPVGQLALAYEALRAQATGELPSVTPRGLALFLAQGFPSWMNGWNPIAIQPITPVVGPRQQPPVGPESEMVQLLTEMALRCQKARTR